METQRKSDYILIRIGRKLKNNFTTINKAEKRNNSEVIRKFIEEYVEENIKNKKD